jgi:Fe-S-cluster containining protein
MTNKKNVLSNREKRTNLSKKQLVSNMQKRNLKDSLQKIYTNDISLETRMSCECVCCKIAMPQMNYCEFLQNITEIWNTWTIDNKVTLIERSLEYFFKNDFEKWGIQSLVKPCMLQDKNGKCTCYESRPLSCRLYGIWPKDEYESRVSRFAKAYEKYGLTREDLPLFNQCPLVERVDTTKELSMEIISQLYAKLDKIDKTIGEFSELEISQKHNYRTFHDWLMFKVFGTDWLSMLTSFMMAANKAQLEAQLFELKYAVKKTFLDIDNKMMSQLKKD